MRMRAIGGGQSISQDGVPRMLMTVPEVAAALCVGRSIAYELVGSGAIGSVRIGRSRRVSVKALEEYISRLEGEQGLGKAS